MKSLIIAGIVLTTLLLSVILGKKKKLFADRYLALYLVFAVVRQIYLYFVAEGLFSDSVWMLLGKGIYLLNAPLFFLYVYSLTKQKPLPRWQLFMIFAPFAGYVLHFFYFYIFVFDHVSLSIVSGLLYVNGQPSLSWLFFVVLFLLIEPFFVAWFYLLLKQYRKKLLDTFAHNTRQNLSWLSVLFYLWLTIAVALVPLSMLTISFNFMSSDVLELLIEVSTVAFFFIVGYYGFKQTDIFSDRNLSEAEAGKSTAASYQRSGLTPHQAKEYHKKLLKLMEEQKPYLNGELTAGELSQLMGISVNHLSQVLNKEQRQNFFDFVNSYRVKEVIRRIEDPANSHLTLLALAMEAGFNSKTSFNTIFKKFTGQTPSAYLKALPKSSNLNRH